MLSRVSISAYVRSAVLAVSLVPAFVVAALPAKTAAAAPAGDKDVATVSVVVYGNDPCPQQKSDEIVVCAREPESERYRIPKRFRGKKQQAAPGNSWNNKVRSTEDASRMAAGLPDTCSAVGTGGQSGCYAHFVGQAAAEQRQQKQDDADDASSGPQ